MLNEMPNRFEKVPRAEVVAWLNHPATKVLADYVRTEARAAQDSVWSLCNQLPQNAIQIARVHERGETLGDLGRLLDEAVTHVGV